MLQVPKENNVDWNFKKILNDAIKLTTIKQFHKKCGVRYFILQNFVKFPKKLL